MTNSVGGAGIGSAPPVSPDGRFWWDGTTWRPFQQQQPLVIAPAKARSFRYQPTIAGSVLIGILVAALLFAGYTRTTSDHHGHRLSPLECSNEQRLDALQNLPVRNC